MGQIFKIQELGKDDEIGIAKKKISCVDNSFSFDGPVVTQKLYPFDSDESKVNEIIKHVNEKTINTIVSNSIKSFTDGVKADFCPKKLNITIFDLQYNQVPDNDTIKVIAQALHGSSEKAIFLPAIRKTLLQSVPIGRKCANYDDTKFSKYMSMLKQIIEEIRMHKNGKEIVGMVPFLPFKYQRQIIDYYFSEGIRTFAIDANFSDLMNNAEDFCLTLSKIKTGIGSLEETVVFAFNAGIAPYDPKEVVSDDFLSVFAYVDVLGSSFKVRGGGNGPLKGKVFSKEKYAYDIMQYPELKAKFGSHVNSPMIKTYNRSEQSKETANIRNLIGQEKIKTYLATKPTVVRRESIKRLETIAKKIG